MPFNFKQYFGINKFGRNHCVNRASYEPIGHIPEVLDCIMGFMDMKQLYRGPLFVNRQWYSVAKEYLDPSANNNAVLFRAIESGNTKVVSQLLGDPRVNPEATHPEHGYSALITATLNKRYKIIQLLLKDGRVDPKAALKVAVRHGNNKAALLLAQDERIELTRSDHRVIHMYVGDMLDYLLRGRVFADN